MNEYLEFKQLLENLKLNNKKPTLLLHSCCGPCSSYVLTLLNEYFDITIYYYNPNIYPYEEFYKRGETQKEIIAKLHFPVKLIMGEHDYNVYQEMVDGLEHLGEGSRRCYNCYFFRMKKCSEVASELGFDYFTTTLSISPYKNSNWINEIGKEVEISSKYLYSNFKKEEGYKKSIELSRHYGLYRQDYCGCISSIKEHEERIRNKNNG
jgi:predicted adenine nucleotide alpha hydrolase (AANH) superfamily ATPase